MLWLLLSTALAASPAEAIAALFPGAAPTPIGPQDAIR